MKPLGEIVFELDDTLSEHGVAYAIGGALALAYYAEPRGTSDVDLTVSTPHSSSSGLVAWLGELGWHPEGGPATSLPVAGTRFVRRGEVIVLDVFFSFDEYHDVVLRNAVRKPFLHHGERRELPFLAANDLSVLKVSFNRTKDWADLEAMVDAGTAIDPDYVERHLVGFKGPTAYPSAARLRRLVELRGPR